MIGVDRTIVAACAGWFAALAAGGPLITLLRRRSLRQHAYEDAPATHRTKTGTPTMGGLLFLLALPIALLAAHDRATLALVGLILGAAAIGAYDDLAAIRSARNQGLRAAPKLLATIVIAVLFLAAAAPVVPAVMWLGVIPLWLWWALSLAAIVGTMHAVNLTDGLDGLAGGAVLPPALVMMLLTLRAGLAGPGFLLAALAGTVSGFLWYNRHPARVFMGDTGSLALGAALAGGAIVAGAQIVLLVVGAVFVAEALSVIIQVVSYKATKRRVFRMSPLHHHFELGGWPETVVVRRFWGASLAVATVGLVAAVRL